MTDRERELINRYVYEVTRRVPREQRDEIELEMRELIGDMLEDLQNLEIRLCLPVSTGKIRIMSSVLSIMTIISG